MSNATLEDFAVLLDKAQIDNVPPAEFVATLLEQLGEWPSEPLIEQPDFRECDSCRAKPGAPTLCADCLQRRAEHSEADTVYIRERHRRSGYCHCARCL